MTISAQFSLYPLRQQELGTAIEEALTVMRERDLEVKKGPMSSLVWGEEERVFSALQEAFAKSAERGTVVWVITLSNACPLPGESGD